MLLGEPPRSPYDLHFSLLGIPVRIHPFFWVIAVLLGMHSPSAVDLLVWIAAIFVSILFHELGHATVMRAYGFSPWITLYGMGGLASYNPAGSYRARGFGALGQVLISAAGPGAGFLLAALTALAVTLSGHHVTVYQAFGFLPLVLTLEIVGSEMLTGLINDVLWVSIFWGYLNLLPIYPLDGGQIAREILLKASPRDGIRHSLMLSIFTAILVAVTALVQLGDLFAALLFGYLAYSSYATLQAYTRRGP